MSLSTPLAAVAGAVVAGAAVFFVMADQSTEGSSVGVSIAANAAATPKIVLDQAVAGELTSDSLLNYYNGVRSGLFSIDTTPGQIINLSTTGALKASLSVFDNGRLIASSKRNCGRCGQRDSGTSLAFMASGSGPYLVAVSGRDERAYGPFELTATLIESHNGAPLNGEQRISDWALGKVLRYTLNIEQDGLYRIDMLAGDSGMDPFLVLQDSEGIHIADDDDSGTGLDARIELPLAAGSYTLIADSALETAEDFHGRFDIQVKKIKTFGENTLIDGQPLTLNAPQRSGQYTGTMLRLPLEITEPTMVTLNAVSSDGSLGLTGPNVSRYNSDNGAKTLQAVLQPGQYQVTLEGKRQGELVLLEARGRPLPANVGGGELNIGEQKQSLLLGSLEHDTYRFTVTQAGNYVIDMKSSAALDSHLWLYRDGVLIDQDDDSGDGLDARLTLSLQPGEYELHAGRADNDRKDYPYTLSVHPVTR